MFKVNVHSIVFIIYHSLLCHLPYILVKMKRNKLLLKNITVQQKKSALIYTVLGGIETHVTK